MDRMTTRRPEVNENRSVARVTMIIKWNDRDEQQVKRTKRKINKKTE